MGCICGKALVKSSIERVSEQKNPNNEVEGCNNSVQLKDPLQETSNESDRIILNNLEFNIVKQQKKEKCFKINTKMQEFSNFYVFSSDFPNELERSHANDWQQLIMSHVKSGQNSLKPFKTENEFINTDWDLSNRVDLTKKILQLPPRQWINEHIYIINQSLCKGKDTGASLKRKNIQLKYQFQWFVWAVTNYFYTYMGGKSRNVGSEFEKLTGCALTLPNSKEEWLEGFIYKFVKFKLAYRTSFEAKYLKAEIKATKLMYLESLNSVSGLVFPLINYSKISPFILFAVPIYPNNYLQTSNDLYLEIFGAGNFAVPRTSAYRLRVEADIFFIYNSIEFVKPESKKKCIVLFEAQKNSKIVFENFYQEEIPKNDVCKMLYGEYQEGVKIEQRFLEYFGWNCCVFWDSNSKLEEKHEFSDFFGGFKGNFIVCFSEGKKRFSRQVGNYLLEGAEVLQHLRFSIRDTVNALENSESINSQSSLVELIHRKGLKGGHQWIIYSKCRSDRTFALLEASLLARGIKKMIFAHMALKEASKASNLKKMVIEIVEGLLKPQKQQSEPYLTLSFILFLDRLWCIQDAIALNNCQQDVSSSRIIEPLASKIHSNEFLMTNEIILKILSAPNSRPFYFFKSLEYHLNIKFTQKFLISTSLDPHDFLCKSKCLDKSDICGLYTPINSITSLKEDSYILYLSLSDKSFNSESSVLSINESQILLMQKENEFTSLDMLLPSDLYSISSRFFKDSYSLPSLTFLEEWASIHESFYKDQLTPSGQESVIIEIYSHIIYIYISHERNAEAGLSVLQKIEKIIENIYYIEGDLIVSYYLWSGICQENFNLAISEQCNITALLLMTRLFGDPRGRNSIGVPWQMATAWKLSKIAREEKRIFDAQLAEEHFDSVQMNSVEFKQKSQKKYNRKYAKQQASIYKNPFENGTEPQCDDLLVWIWNNSLSMFSTNSIWSQAEVREYIKLTQIGHLPAQMSQIVNTSGASTPSSYKDTKRAMQQSSLSQALLVSDCALHTENAKGVVYIWGSDTDGQLGVGNEQEGSLVLMHPRMLTALKDFIITEVAAGALHCLAITQEGNCFAWGNNENFQLGLGPDLPKLVTSPVQIKAASNIKSAACGYQHSMLLNYSGQVFTMGIGDGGVLGHGNCQTVMYPKMLLGIKKVNVTQIEAGGYHNLILSEQGHVYVWGRGDGGQLGIDQEELGKMTQEVFVDSPIRLLSILQDEIISQIACGEAHNLVLTSSGKVFAWGWGSNGQLGNGYREEDFEESGNLLSIQYTPAPILSFVVKVSQISAGGLFSMFLTEDHEVYICGANDKRQLGLELETRDVAIPTRIECFMGYPVQKIACGESHCIAVADKIVWTWGNYLDHRLGLGELSGSAMPRPLQTLTNSEISKIACGRIHTMAIVGKPQNRTQPTFEPTLNWKLEF